MATDPSTNQAQRRLVDLSLHWRDQQHYNDAEPQAMKQWLINNGDVPQVTAK